MIRPMMILDALGEIRLTHTMDLIAEILDSGTNNISVTLCDPKTYGEAAFDETIKAVEYVAKVTSVNEIEPAMRENRLSIFYQLQNATPIQRDLDRVELLKNLGIRNIQLTYNYQNYVGSGCRERDNRGGDISAFGAELIECMNAIELSRSPIIISHTCCESVHHHVRNTTDENLKKLADKGGVVGICQIRPFITDETSDNLSSYFDHIDHAVNIAGLEHVCIGSDRDHRVIEDNPEEIRILQEEEGAQFQPEHWPLYVSELNGPRRMEVVLQGLEKRGYKEDAVEQIGGKNLYRLYADVIG